MTELKHLGTRVITTFGVVDGDNVIAQQPIEVGIQDFAPAQFTKAHKIIRERRDEITAASEAAEAEANRAQRRARARARRPKR